MKAKCLACDGTTDTDYTFWQWLINFFELGTSRGTVYCGRCAIAHAQQENQDYRDRNFFKEED